MGNEGCWGGLGDVCGWRGRVDGEWGMGPGERTYYRAHCILIERIPPYRHHHRIHRPLLPLPLSLPLPLTSPFPLRYNDNLPILPNIQPRPPIINPALNALIPTDAQARDRDVGGRDAEFAAAAPETLDDGAGEADWEGGGGGCGAGGGEGAGG